jgi:hypothetical protein
MGFGALRNPPLKPLRYPVRCLLARNHPVHQQHEGCHKYKNTYQPNHNDVEGIQIFGLFVVGTTPAQANEGPGDGLGGTPQ